MVLELHIDELTLLSQLLEDIKFRQSNYRFLSCSQEALLNNIINRVDNKLSE